MKELEEILAKIAPNFERGVSVNRQANSLVSGKEALEAMKQAYNLGIQKAADNAEADIFEDEDPTVGKFASAAVSRESILCLKIT